MLKLVYEWVHSTVIIFYKVIDQLKIMLNCLSNTGIQVFNMDQPVIFLFERNLDMHLADIVAKYFYL